LRHEEKLLKKKKKSRSRFGRFVLILILVIVFLVLAFYFLNNPSAYAGLKAKLSSFYSSQSTDKPGSTDNAGSTSGENNSGTTTSNGNDNTESADGNTGSAAGQDNTGLVSETDANSSGSVSEGAEFQTTPESSVKESAYLKNQNTSAAGQSFWQKIIAFFKLKMGSQADNFPGTLDLKVYFAALGQDEVFVFEERQINAGSPRVAVENTVNELLKGPSKSFHYPVIPPGTKLLGVQIYENLAKIDFSQEFLENSLESGILDDYVIYTIVNTVTQVPGVEGVIFLIDGKRIKLYGSVDISIPAIKNEKYLPVENSEGVGE
jgi:spore germination protein GerM